MIASGSPRKRYDRAVKKGASEILVLGFDDALTTRVKTIGDAKAEAALANLEWARS